MTDDLGQFVQAVKEAYGYDFSGYDPNYILKRLNIFNSNHGLGSLTESKNNVLGSRDQLIELIDTIAIPFTELFRNPEVFLVIRKTIIPYLRTFPRFKIWHAGCSTGEEAYSLAILLADEGLLESATIYATDINPIVINKARKGQIPKSIVRRDEEKYLKSGGRASLSSYYTIEDDYCVVSETIAKRIIFAEHNLATDASFGEMNLILCRNVLIYFTKELQTKVLRMLQESLCHDGFLCLGSNESLFQTGVFKDFHKIDVKEKVYQKKALE